MLGNGSSLPKKGSQNWGHHFAAGVVPTVDMAEVLLLLDTAVGVVVIDRGRGQHVADVGADVIDVRELVRIELVVHRSAAAHRGAQRVEPRTRDLVSVLPCLLDPS